MIHGRSPLSESPTTSVWHIRCRRGPSTPTAQGHHLPDRRQAAARGDQGAQPPGKDAWRAAAGGLPAHRQRCGGEGVAHPPPQKFTPCPGGVPPPAPPPRPPFSRPPPKGRRWGGTR